MQPEEPAPSPRRDLLTRSALPFSLDDADAFHGAVDALITRLGPEVRLLGLGEALHGGEEILLLRNRLFERLVAAHGYRAIALQTSAPKAWAVNEYIAGRGPTDYADVQDAGFSHRFGRLDANRELVEWMRAYNADPAHGVPLRFYGFDAPVDMGSADSPRQLLGLALDYLATVAPERAVARRQNIEWLIGDDASWENPSALLDPSEAVGRSPEAVELRVEVEDLIADLGLHGPDAAGRGDGDGFRAALWSATQARQLLTYHAVVAGGLGNRVSECLRLRDGMMADNLAAIVAREYGQESGRGKVLAFGHNQHLRRGRAEWQTDENRLAWWPAGAHLTAAFGPAYAVIGSAVGTSPENGIPAPEPGTREHLLIALPAAPAPTAFPARFVPLATLPPHPFDTLPTRPESRTNHTYAPLPPSTRTDFDALAVLDHVTYHRGGRRSAPNGEGE